jgi:hypothetical protein
MKLIIAVFLIAVLVLQSCAKKSEEGKIDTTPAAPAHLTIEPATDSPAYPDAKLTIVSPREGQALKNPKDSVLVILQVSGIQLGAHTDSDSTKGIAYSKQGQHVHVIVDEKPYMADYKNGQPFNVGVLPEGMHTIRAFPSFSWHESIKAPNAFATRTFYVGNAPRGNAAPSNNLNGPMLTYSRPKGTYIGGEAAKVLLDFYISNATLDTKGYTVKWWIDGAPQSDIVKWQPYFISGLAKGKHTIKLSLVDAKGTVVPGSYNSPSQEITVE